MLGLALALALLVLTGRQSQASFDSPDPKLLVSGAPLRLHASPSIQRRAVSVVWKAQLRTAPQVPMILTWKSEPDSGGKNWKCNPHFKNTRCFIMENRTLVIEVAQPQDSGIYLLEATNNETGEAKTFCFNVSVWGGNMSYGDVSYTWYRGSERILGPGNLSTLEEQIGGGLHAYTCQVSNLVSQANQTLRLSQGCLPEIGLLPFWMIIVSLTTVLLLGTGILTWVCVWRRRKKQAERSPEECVTIYEDVNNLRPRGSHEQWQEEQDSHMAGTTVYSMILAQPSASPSRITENTLYSVVQSSQKGGSKRRKQSPALTCTVYEEVGKTQAKAQSPVLTRKELENFRVYC
ncbi:natural killer cell receptor 2B4 isoform X2 [Desmodus rotundus]|uniref:natural killer cell receptor 2B4 isoform X2 n=1 Tax=Desmodus rotundus TaxID=9430 RepID=UPI001E1C0BB2|nr:natural killer cell receptor 2B4 isoform X2 [Desmodus rotundus]